MKKRKLLLTALFGVMILSACGGNNASTGSFNSSNGPVVSQSSTNKEEPSKPSSTQKPSIDLASQGELINAGDDVL